MMTRRKITTVGITTRREFDNQEILTNLIHCLNASNKEIYVTETAEQYISNKDDSMQRLRDFPEDKVLDLFIVLGGDGTILHSIRKLRSFDTYIFGINAGTLGFLSEVPPDNLENTCLTIWDANYTLDERMLLKVVVDKKNGETKEYVSLNEVVISQAAVARLVKLPTKIDNFEVATFSADGLIVATPTGSTAYNLSAGGPILHPRVEAMILTPIAPFSFTQKPLVIPSDKTVQITVPKENDENMVITTDGQIHEPLHAGDVITVSRHAEKVKFLRLPGENYFKTLRQKLNWGETF